MYVGREENLGENTKGRGPRGQRETRTQKKGREALDKEYRFTGPLVIWVTIHTSQTPY